MVVCLVPPSPPDFFYELDNYTYRDMNFGDHKRFHGIEKIWLRDTLVYELQYFGGTVKK